jgi:basic membrane protein A and related proteins
MVRIYGIVGALCLCLASLVTPAAARGLSSHHQDASNFRVGVVLDVGGVNDKSFNHLAFLGLSEGEALYHVKGYYVVSHSQADYVPNLTHFAQLHYNLVIAVGFLMAGAIYTVAKAFPNTKFAIVDSAPANAAGNTANLPNVANLFFKEQESGYLVGVIAGLMEKGKVGKAKHNVIGYMGGLSIPPVNRYIAGYIRGAKKVDPGIKILSGYSQSFTDQGKGKEVGLAQIGQGADILFQVAGGSGLGYLAAAQQQGRYGIGVDADQGYLGKYVITSALKKVDVAVSLTIGDTFKHKFRGGDHEFTLKNNCTGFAPVSGSVPASIVAQARVYLKKIKSGQITPSPNIP